MRPPILAGLSFIIGAAATFASVKALSSKPIEPKPEPKSDEPAFTMDDKALGRANANLTSALQACNHKLSELGEAPPPAVHPEPTNEDAGRRNRRNRVTEPTKEDWDRMSQAGMLRVRIPCLRDTPWSPNARAIERLGLAPSDADSIKQAYASSNKRVMDQIRPLCAKALGSADVLDKVGPSACMDAIANGARKADAAAMKTSLSRVADMQSGKIARANPDPNSSSVAQLAGILANEQSAFESDLAQKLGPDEGKRIAWSPDLCTDRRNLRATNPGDDEAAGEGFRGR